MFSCRACALLSGIGADVIMHSITLNLRSTGVHEKTPRTHLSCFCGPFSLDTCSTIEKGLRFSILAARHPSARYVIRANRYEQAIALLLSFQRIPILRDQHTLTIPRLSLTLRYLQTMWAARHDVSSLFMYCSAAVSAITGTTSITFSAGHCVSTKVLNG